MDRYQVNLRVVNGALDRLENAGAIRRERYRGIFCRETRHPDISSILLIMPDFPGAEMDSFAELVRNHITEYPEFRLQLQRFLKNDIDKPPSEEVAAILLFGDSAPPSMQMLTCLADWRKPVIFFCRQYDDLPFSCVNHNNTEGGMLACEYLISHGCRSLLTIHSECPLYDVEERFCAFETYAKLHNVPCRRLNSQISAEESANYHVSSSLTEYLNTYGCHFDGIFLDSYTSAQGVFSALRNYGLRIPDDVSVIAFHGFGEESPLPAAPDHSRLPPGGGAASAFRPAETCVPQRNSPLPHSAAHVCEGGWFRPAAGLKAAVKWRFHEIPRRSSG